MAEDIYTDHPCDLCGADDAHEIPEAVHYTDGQPLHVCRQCGFVHVRARRSAERIAEVWSDDIYQTDYTARIPAVKARQIYVAEFIDTTVGLKDQRVLDIGGGEGQFLEMIMAPDYGAKVFAVEPSAPNCDMMEGNGIATFCGSVESYRDSDAFEAASFDVVTVMWTLENCTSCNDMLAAAWDALKPGGHIVISTGSRILVPFKKPMQYYLGPNPADTHCFRVSANTLTGLLAENAFELAHINRFVDTDYLVAAGRKAPRDQKIDWPRDDWRAVADFFTRWHTETQAHYKDA